MNLAVNSKSNRTPIKSRAYSAAIGAFCIALIVFLMTASCGPGLAGAKSAVERAEEQGRKLEAENTPNEDTIVFRMHLKKAQLALEKRRYGRASKEAEAATKEAEKLLQQRQSLSGELGARLEKLKTFIETQPRPKQMVVDGYFDALEAVQDSRFEQADRILAEIETNVIQQFRHSDSDLVSVQADAEYFKQHKFIPVYSKISDDGTPGPVIWQLKDNVYAKFLGAKYIKRDLIFVHILIEEPKYKVQGWVNKRFVD